MVYVYIFVGSYALFFIASGLYVLISRNNAAAVYREAGLSEDKIADQLASDEWKGYAVARRATVVNGSLFALMLAMAYTVTAYLI